MKFYTVLLPLIAALAMSPAFAEEKSMSGPDMSPADISQDAKSMKDMKGMKDMKKMHKHCMEESKKEGAVNADTQKTCTEDMKKSCMEEGNKDSTMSKDMQDMHKNCVKKMEAKEQAAAKTKKTMPKHHHRHHDTSPAQ